jgi:hypothetical protein
MYCPFMYSGCTKLAACRLIFVNTLMVVFQKIRSALLNFILLVDKSTGGKGDFNRCSALMQRKFTTMALRLQIHRP